MNCDTYSAFIPFVSNSSKNSVALSCALANVQWRVCLPASVAADVVGDAAVMMNYICGEVDGGVAC